MGRDEMSELQLIMVVPRSICDDGRWWAHGGAEMMDEIDPDCTTEHGDGATSFRVTQDWLDDARSLRDADGEDIALPFAVYRCALTALSDGGDV